MNSFNTNLKTVWEYQPPAVLNQATPTQNDWYTILDTTKNCLIYFMSINVEDDNETLEVQITVDGETIASFGVACDHSVQYHVYIQTDAVGRIDYTEITTVDKGKAFELFGKSVKIEVRKTTATGTGNLTGIVMYGILKNAG